MNILLDEEATPTPREVIGRLLTSATHVEIAVSHVRLGAIDLTTAETGHVSQCRILLDRLDAHALAGGAAAHMESDRFRALLEFVSSDRVEIRSAGVSAWVPDFSIYRGLSDAGAGAGAVHGEAVDAAVCLVGAHYFIAPAATPAWTCVLTDAQAVALALSRFDVLWEHGHDVRDAVIEALQHLAGEGHPARAES